MDDYKRFGNILWETRRKDSRRVSLQAVSEIAKCSRKTWRKYERGEGAPDAIMLFRVENYFGWKLRLKND